MASVEIIEMAQHFLYLPFYYARDNDFFGYVGAEYTTSMGTAFPATDEGALRQMLSNHNDDVLRFSLCDPGPLYAIEHDDDDPPAVLAAVITNAAIWAIDKEAEPVTDFRELKKFNNVIAFKKGTTTFGMAMRLWGEECEDRIVSVEPGHELYALTLQSDAVAFSPEILDAVNAIQQGTPLKIILPLGATREYDSVLVTALVTKKSVVREHPKLVEGMLAGLQHAIIEVNLSSPQILEYAAHRFNRSKELISSALDEAAHATVFPPNIMVQRNHWEAAAESYSEGQGQQYTAEAKMASNSLYKRCALPYIDVSRKAMELVSQRGLREAGDSRSDDTCSRALPAFAGCSLGCVIAGVALFGGMYQLPLIVALFGGLAVLGVWLKAPNLSFPRIALHYAFYLVCGGLMYLVIYVYSQNQLFVGLGLGTVTIVLGADFKGFLWNQKG
jgi:hypothetical protein